MKLMSNNPTKRTGLIGYGLEITENVELEFSEETQRVVFKNKT